VHQLIRASPPTGCEVASSAASPRPAVAARPAPVRSTAIGGAADDPEDARRASTDFERAVDRVLRSLQPGQVVTYGEVALEAGRPGAARAVGALLAGSGGGYPWWRVVTAAGRLVPGHEHEQERRLRAEGVELRHGRVVTPR
jgi:methylated-DNA-protein-cysteine methyltransferase related protein